MLTERDLETACISIIDFLRSRGEIGSDFEGIYTNLREKQAEIVRTPNGIGVPYLLHYLMKDKKIRYSMGNYRVL